MKESGNRNEVLAQLDRKTEVILEMSAHCAQSSFAALEDQFRLDGGQTLKALTPFPGIAFRGETCGAVVGCLMALGLVYGRDSLNDREGLMASIPPAREFCRQFEDQVGGITCQEILSKELGKNYDLSKQAEVADYLACGGKEAKKTEKK